MIRTAVIGSSGYVAGELIRLLLNHREVELVFLGSRSHKNKFLHQIHPNFRKIANIMLKDYEEFSAISSKCDVVFLSGTNEASLKLVPLLLKKGLKVIDLSPMFRLKDPRDYAKYYNLKHPNPNILESAVYGLPEINREAIKQANLIACPGCIATASILALYPLVNSGLIKGKPIIIDSKMGSSGFGSKVALASIYSERYNSVRVYKPSDHRHTPEINQELSKFTKHELGIALSAHGVNMVRGLLATIHCFYENEISLKDLWKVYRAYYGKEKFIRLVREEKGIHRYPDPKTLIGSNFCDIGFEIDEDNKRLIIISALDNLIKGAAGNAIQCMNIMFNVEEDEGLREITPYPI